MTRGDVINEVVSALAGSIVEYQPATGVEVLLKSVSAGQSGTDFGLYDGVNNCIFLTAIQRYESGTDPRYLAHTNLSILLNNAHYLRIEIDGLADDVIMYTGIQTK